MTSLLDSLLAVLLAAIASLAVGYQIRLRVPRSDSTFVVRLFFWAIALRFGLALVLNIFAADSYFAATFWGDSGSYDLGGYQLAQRWSGEPVSSVYMLSAISGYGWIYFVGVVYYIFGQNQLLIQFMNGLMSGITVVIIYLITVRLFDSSSARWSALFMAFFPQMVFWSAGMYKDPAILLCIATSMFAALRLRERFSIGIVLLFVFSEFVLISLRFYIAYFVAFAALATFLFSKRQGTVRLVTTYLFLGGILLVVLNVAVRRETLERQASYMTLERLQTTREDQAMWSRSGFGQEYDVSTPAGAVAAFPVGLVYLLFSPFPWAVSGVRQALAVPETLVWYALMPAFVRGLVYALRHRPREVLPILVFAVTLTGAYALMQGNVGTAYRQRTQISMFFFVFMGVGLAERQRRKTEASARALRPAGEHEY